MIAGYGGLVSLGHAGLFGIAAYATGYMLQAGFGHTIAILTALVVGVASMAVYAVLSLRATGIGFIMITLALGEIIWGLAYRWISITGGDNGINLHGRPEPFGIAITSASAFYYTTLVTFIVAFAAVAVFVKSPMGAALMGTRDQPRRMNALGYHVWAIRFWACMFSGLLTTISGILFVYYTEFISPQALDLTASAEVLLMVISGGAGTLFGPVVGAALVVIVKSVVSGFIERWNFLLGAIFVAIVILMPEGLVPGHRAAVAAGMEQTNRQRAHRSGQDGGVAMSALTITGLCKAFEGLHVTNDVDLDVAPGERRLIIGPNGAGKTTLFNLITGELARRRRHASSCTGRTSPRMPAAARAQRGVARTYQIITLFPHDTLLHNVKLALARALAASAGRPWGDLRPRGRAAGRALEALDGRGPGGQGRAAAAPRPPTETSAGWRSPWRWPSVPAPAAARRAPGRAVGPRSARASGTMLAGAIGRAQ